MKVTVAICTWNRSKLLSQTLEQLTRLRVPDGTEWELLIVNNASTDDTDAVIARYTQRLPLRRLFEPLSGHTHARNCAILGATGDFLVWTDDDVIVDRDWLRAFDEAFRQYPHVALFVGPVEAWFETPPPAWIRRHFSELSGPLVALDHGPEARALKAGEALFGANMAVRLDVARGLMFNTAKGRIKDSLFGGDDTDFAHRLMASGHQAMWIPSARVKHFTTSERLTRGYIEKWYRDAGRSVVRTWPSVDGKTIRGVPRWLLLGYLTKRTKALCLRPLGNRAWLTAYRQALQMSGMIQECRSRGSRTAPESSSDHAPD